MHKNNKIAVFLILLILSIVSNSQIYAMGEIRLENPRLLYQLTGKWRFSAIDRPEFKKADFDDSSWEWIQVPGQWISLGVRNVTVGWYRFHFTVSSQFQNIFLSILSSPMADSHEFYLNGVKIGGFGEISETGEIISKKMRPTVLDIPPDLIHQNGDNVIALRIGDNFGWGGVVTSDFFIGSKELIDLRYKKDNIWNISVIIILLFLSLYAVFLYLYLARETSFLDYSLLALLIGLTLTGYLYCTYWLVDSYWLNLYLLHMGLNTAMIFAFRFSYSFLDLKPGKLYKLVHGICALLSFILILIPLDLKIARFYSHVSLNVVLLLNALGCLYLGYLVIQSIRLKKPGSLTSGMGSLVILICFVTDILGYVFALPIPRLGMQGTVVFMVSNTYGLFIKHSRISSINSRRTVSS